jgi:hypothetical protein
MRRFFVCLVVCIREGFAPERVAQLGYGGFLMLEYQKSSAAAPKPRNWFGLEYFCQPQSVGRGHGQVTISGTPA